MLKFGRRVFGISAGVVHDEKRLHEIVDSAIAIGAKRVQLFKLYFNKAMIDKAHANAVKCNVFFADEPEEAEKYLEMGADTILTNDYLKIKNAILKWMP